MTVIDEIIAKRRSEIEAGTDTGGYSPPSERTVPLADFGQEPFIITEVKKKSPSKGIFTEDFNHIKSASSYIEQGMKNISVITEKNYFAGSLEYLYEIKQKYPEAAVLRKDFLICENDIEVSWNCGADALLLIASALDKKLLEKLYFLTVEKGMKPLVEIHDEKDLEKVRSFKPFLVGINSRDLRDFSVDMINPVSLRSKIDWEADVVYESGIGSRSDAVFAFSSGFSGILTGESVIKNPSLASVYKDVYYSIKNSSRNPERYFWNRIFSGRNKVSEDSLKNSSDPFSSVSGKDAGNISGGRAAMQSDNCRYSSESGKDAGSISGGRAAMQSDNCRYSSESGKNAGNISGETYEKSSEDSSRRSRSRKPLVKICGITNREDCLAAVSSGADMIGMVFAPSVRKADINLPYELADIDIVKVAVVVNPDKSLTETLKSYYSRNLIDAVQLSGDESPEFCSKLDIPFYKTIRIKDESEYETGERYHSVRILTDSFSKKSYGGTGKKVPEEILEKISEKAKGRLWLAGGISPDNAAEITEKYSPELLDASSSLELSPGRKDRCRMELFIRAVKGEIKSS